MTGHTSSSGSLGNLEARGTEARNISVSPLLDDLLTPCRFLDRLPPIQAAAPHPGISESGGQVNCKLETKNEEGKQTNIVSSSGHIVG